MFIDTTPLRRHRDFRLLFAGQLISDLGSAFTYVALPYQIYHLTGSSLAVGMIGLVQLVPLIAAALIGGALADSFNRRKLLIFSEVGLASCSFVLALSARGGKEWTPAIYVLAALLSTFKGLHRPSLEALTPRLVDKQELLAASALSSLRGTIARIGGPAIAGISISLFGLWVTYALDAATFLISLSALVCIRTRFVSSGPRTFNPRTIVEGLRYALSRQELMGTYLVDIAAMVFGMPMALFPAIAQKLGGPLVLGWLYSAPEVGALLATLLSGWTKKVRHHGRAVVFAASIWGIAIIGFGLAQHLVPALLLLALAGAADMVSGIFRQTMWNQTIPDSIRGRMAGIEMISYMSGPLLGNAEAGFVAARFGVGASVVSGGVLCVVGVWAFAWILPRFWNYESTPSLTDGKSA